VLAYGRREPPGSRLLSTSMLLSGRHPSLRPRRRTAGFCARLGDPRWQLLAGTLDRLPIGTVLYHNHHERFSDTRHIAGVSPDWKCAS
jgi:hypothetical protein